MPIEKYLFHNNIVSNHTWKVGILTYENTLYVISQINIGSDRS